MPFDPLPLRRQFPLFNQKIEGHPPVYLDTAATSQKPQCVLDAITNFYSTTNANINRGVHPLAEAATVAYDKARSTVSKFIGAKHAHEVIFTRNTTESMNLIARSWGEVNLKKGDAIVLTAMEHHSNIVPWLQLKEKTGCAVEWISVTPEGELNQAEIKKIFEKGKVKLVSITGLSNVLGCKTPLQEMIKLAHEHGAKVCVDAAQLIVHEAVDVKTLDCDFLAFSGHKLYGPMGIGVLYAKQELLKGMPAFLGGGDMIATVTKSGFTSAELPRKFEAGTPSVADAVGLAAAIDWLSTLNRTAIERHESSLLKQAIDELKKIPGIRIFGPSEPTGCVSFTIDGVHPHDLTEVLGRQGICLRAGHHCTQVLHDALGVNATARLSVGLYNTTDDIDMFLHATTDAIKRLKR